MRNCKVSVLMPAYNAEKYIDEAIQSVVDQTFQDWELVVINDGSKDGTWQKIQNWMRKDERIKGFNNEINLGLCKTLNMGIDLCTAEYIARLDSDDYSPPDRLESQFSFLEQHANIGVVGSHIFMCDENLKIKNERRYNLVDNNIRAKLFYFCPIVHGVIMIRKKVIVEAGKFNQNMAPAEDYDLWFRVAKITKMANLDKFLLYYRVYSGSSSQSNLKLQEIKTLYTRIKAVIEYGYTMNLIEKIYFLFQICSIILVPYQFKFWIFNKIRKYIK